MNPVSLCRWQVQLSIYCAWRIPAQFFMADISILDLFVCGCRTWICLDITRLYEEQRQQSSGSEWPACPKNGKSGPHCWGREVLTQFVQQLVTAVTAPPLVGCVVWNFFHMVASCILDLHLQTESHADRSIENCDNILT